MNSLFSLYKKLVKNKTYITIYMSEKVNIIKKYRCNICNKDYSSNSSLCNHNKKFHNKNVEVNVKNVKENVENNKSLKCDFCNKLFNSRSAKSHHKKICKTIDINNKINKIDQLENTINEMKKQFSLILQEKGKIHHKTLQKINNTINNSNNNINNGNIINNTFVKFGDVEYQKILNNSQIKQILNKQYHSLEASIKQIHFNENLPEYSNFFITNMKDDLAYIFNGKQFISVMKNM